VIWLLDTSIVIHALNGVVTVRDRSNAAAEDDRIVTSTIVVAELTYGAECSTRREENRRRIQQKLRPLIAIRLPSSAVGSHSSIPPEIRHDGGRSRSSRPWSQ
jgi:predicted nucleic acid-binding protein